MTPTKPRVLLKGRPTTSQLADRGRPPQPEGIELYLDLADISGDDWLERLRNNVSQLSLAPAFSWVVEGPLRSLDGEFFDIARDAEADREVLRRISAAAVVLGAPAVVIHCMSLATGDAELEPAPRQRALSAAVPFLRYFVELCQGHGLIASIENVPPVARMREGAFRFPLIGLDPADLLVLCRQAPGLRTVLDTSHAQLYLNAVTGHYLETEAALQRQATFARQNATVFNLAAYIDALAPTLYEAHISNARGLLDEGMRFDDGDADLAAAIVQLIPYVEFFVTEPLEPDAEHAVNMRQMAATIMALRDRNARGEL